MALGVVLHEVGPGDAQGDVEVELHRVEVGAEGAPRQVDVVDLAGELKVEVRGLGFNVTAVSTRRTSTPTNPP